MLSKNESTKNDFEKAKEELIGIINEASDSVLKFQIKYGKHLTPNLKKEIGKDLAPLVSNINGTLNSIFPEISIKLKSIKGSK